MTNAQYDRFFDLIGNDTVDTTRTMATEMTETEFVNSITEVVMENPAEYNNVADELHDLASKYWNDLNK
jgi:hypothetical protein